MEPPPQSPAPPVAVTIDPAQVVVAAFMGFGVEWDSRNYAAAGVTEADFAIIQRRVEWLRLPVARIMMLSQWCYRGNGRYDWDTPPMRALYRHLDVCQRLGTTVLLTDWGLEREWLKTPDVEHVEDPLYAAIIGTYLDHLRNVRGYTCLQYFILVNEPNQEVGDWARWKTGVENVAAVFRARGLDRHIQILGSDHSGGNDWHTQAVDQLPHLLGGYDIHRYCDEESIRSGAVQLWFKGDWDYARAHDPAAHAKPMVVGEAGLWMPGSSAGCNPLHLEPRYGIAMADYAVQAVNAGSSTVVAWMLDDNSHPNFTWGMWHNRAGSLALKPWFYPWAVLTRCFPPGSRIIRTQSADPAVRVLAAQHPNDQAWSFCIVNRSPAAQVVRLEGPAGRSQTWDHYIYGQAGPATDPEGFPVPVGRITGQLADGVALGCDPDSVHFLIPVGDS